MALITRLARLWRADINALLDRLEDPDLVLAQSLREMEQTLDSDRHARDRIQGEIERLAKRIETCTQTLEHSETALEDCLAEDRDDLARTLIRRRLETENELRQLIGRRDQLSDQAQRFGQRIGERESRLTDLRAQAALYARFERPTEVTDGAPVPTSVRDHEVEIQLLRAKRRRGGAA